MSLDKVGIMMFKTWFSANNIQQWLENFDLLIKRNTRIRSLLNNISLSSEDKIFRNYFENTIAPRIYSLHLNDTFISCIFCSHLYRTYCHEYCFKCSKNTYSSCSVLLPGTYPFCDSYFDTIEHGFAPWMFKTPCINFDRLSEDEYFKNFISNDPSITTANYEALEGIFIGISSGEKPCHICASVNIKIYDHCMKTREAVENKPCNKIIRKLSKKFGTSFDMIKYQS
jgi:hypothetical protein